MTQNPQTSTPVNWLFTPLLDDTIRLYNVREVLVTNPLPPDCDLRACSPEEAAAVARTLGLHLHPAETVLGLLFGGSDRLVAAVLLGQGLPDRVYANGQKLCRAVLAANALSVILAHNHPSGELLFSGADRIMAVTLSSLVRLHGARLTDSIIVGPDTDAHASLRRLEPDLLSAELAWDEMHARLDLAFRRWPRGVYGMTDALLAAAMADPAPDSDPNADPNHNPTH